MSQTATSFTPGTVQGELGVAAAHAAGPDERDLDVVVCRMMIPSLCLDLHRDGIPIDGAPLEVTEVGKQRRPGGPEAEDGVLHHRLARRGRLGEHGVVIAMVAVAVGRQELLFARGIHILRRVHLFGYFARYSLRNCSCTALGNVSMV